MATYFISDLHLSPAQPKVAAGLFKFLNEQAKDADALYILGDFFDAWIGDDEDSDAAKQIKQALRALTDSGVAGYFIHGNRDFLVGAQFCRETGLTLLEESTVIELYGERALIMHGDILCTQDKEYMQFRSMVRNPQWQEQVLSVPLAQRRQMAVELRNKSKSMNAMKADEIMDVTESEVQQHMSEHRVQCLIHGHTHRPNVHDMNIGGKTAQRVVLGDWSEQGWYLKASPEGKELVSFAL